MDFSQSAYPVSNGSGYAIPKTDPLDCARTLAAINAIQFHMMPQAPINTYWSQTQTYPPPQTSPFLSGYAPWIPPLPSPFLMGITCDGIPVKKAKRKAKTVPVPIVKKTIEKTRSSIYDNNQSLSTSEWIERQGDGPTAVSDIPSLENSTSVQSVDTCTFPLSYDEESLLLEDFDLFSSDFDVFLNELTNDSFEEVDIKPADYALIDVNVPRRKRSKRKRSAKKLSSERLQSLLSSIST